MSVNDSLGKNENFLEQIIKDDLGNSHSQNQLRFRFPPEPNGYLHIGHAKSICINFGFGQQFSSPVNLRFDDTNPEKEEQKYIDAIKKDIKWLNYKWDEELYASDYFDILHSWAKDLITSQKAYVDSQNSDEIASQKGTPTEPGSNSPYRERSVDENLLIFDKMTSGEYDSGQHVLRAKIDMSSPNMLMRDPVIYRVIKKSHPRTKDKWVVYPMYDWTHGESDYIEQISHSLCTLEFKPHRELYDWFLDQVVDPNKIRPKQREFARLNLSHTITSKRKLLYLVENNFVDGWDDPRMPTISGLRRRGYSPDALKKFVQKAGVAKRENIIEMSLLEFCAREDLNKKCNRLMVVQNPIKITLTNYSLEEEKLDLINNPENVNAGSRKVSFSKHLYIEKDDFMENPPKKFFRLSLGNEVRLKGAYIIKANNVIKNEKDEVIEIECTYDPKSKSGSGSPESQRKVKGTLHWTSQNHSVNVEIREYERLFNDASPGDYDMSEFKNIINTESVKYLNGYGEKILQESLPGEPFQFQRKGYYVSDLSSTKDKLIFNKTVGLRDNYKKKPV